jgi:hypothetical protein
MTDNTDNSDFFWAKITVGIMWVIGFLAHNYHVIAGNILVTMSIAYLIWKWRRDYKKEQANESIHTKK